MADPAKIDTARGVSAVDGTTKAKLERAALELFVEKGIDGVTTREIAAAAGLSEGVIYRHFKSKEDLARQLFMAIHTHLTDMVKSIATSPLELSDQVDELVISYCHTADDDWTLFAYHILHMTRFLPGLPPGQDSPVAQAEAILSNAKSKGQINYDDVRVQTAMVMGVVINAALTKVYGHLDGDLSRHTSSFRRAIMAILKAG